MNNKTRGHAKTNVAKEYKLLRKELAELKKTNNILARQYAEDYKRLMKLEAGYAHMKTAYADILAGPADIRSGNVVA